MLERGVTPCGHAVTSICVTWVRKHWLCIQLAASLASVLEKGGWGRSHGHVGVTIRKNGARGSSRWVGGGLHTRAPGPASQGPAQALTFSKTRPTTVLSF